MTFVTDATAELTRLNQLGSATAVADFMIAEGVKARAGINTPCVIATYLTHRFRDELAALGPYDLLINRQGFTFTFTRTREQKVLAMPTNVGLFVDQFRFGSLPIAQRDALTLGDTEVDHGPRKASIDPEVKGKAR